MSDDIPSPIQYCENTFTIGQQEVGSLQGCGLDACSFEPLAVEQAGVQLGEDNTLQSRINQLESRLIEQQKLIDELDGRLDEENLKCGILEFTLDQHKDMILQKSEELKQRDQTIGAQECLLGLALADAQNMMSVQQETETLLRRYIKDAFAGERSAESEANKKRRLM